MDSWYANLGSVLLLSLAVAAGAAACGGGSNATSSAGSAGGAGGHATSSGTGGTQSSASGTGGISLSTSGSGGNTQGFDVEPKALQTIKVTAGQTKPTVTYKATLNGKAISVGWGVDLGNVATIPSGPSPAALFAPTGNAGGMVTITAGLNGKTIQRQVMVELTATQNGPGTSPAEQAQMPGGVADLTNGGGVGGVGGEGLGSSFTGFPSTTMPAAMGLAFLYPYDKTVWPRGLPAPLLQWTWAPGDADAIRIGLKTANGSFTYTGTFGPPPILKQTSGKFTRMPIPQDVWDMATNSAGGAANPLTVSLTVAKGGAAYGPITETWTIAPARLSGTIYYQSYGTQLVQNECCNTNGTSFGAAVLAIHVGDTAPKVIAGNGGECRTCHSVAAFGKRLIAMPYGNYSDYELSPSGATEIPLSNSGAWFPGLYPDGSMMLTGDGALIPLPNGGTPITTTGLSTPNPYMPAFSPDGKLVAFNPAVGSQLVVMGFDATSNTFSNQVVVADDTAGGATPGWPAFFPDGKSVVFEQETAPSALDGHGDGILWTRENAKGHIAWTSAAGSGSVTDLDQLNGKGYLPAMASPIQLSCLGDNGYQEGTNLDGAHATDADMNYEPTVNPLPSGGYAWVVFTSRRLYGSVAAIPPYCSDPRGVDLIDNITTKKLWVSAIDLGAKPGTDASHPAFYLPAQELLAGNSRGFWVLDPCQADGTSCTTGDQCCNGYCEADGDGGALICSNMPPSGTCSMPGDKCKSSSDCCDAGDLCINGFCTQSTPQ